MANIDSRIKRQSATCLLVPILYSGVFPNLSGLNQSERQGVSWCYSGLWAHAHEIGETIISMNLNDGSFSISL